MFALNFFVSFLFQDKKESHANNSKLTSHKRQNINAFRKPKTQAIKAGKQISSITTRHSYRQQP
jgi:hypothetical protein